MTQPARKPVNKNKNKKSRNVFQVSAGGVVINRGRILILRKFNGLYCIPKGRIEEGEKLEDTAVREVKEETNITGNILGYIGKVKYSYRNYKRNTVINKEVHWYLMEAKSFKPKPQKKEGFVEAGFYPYEEALKRLRYHDERTIVRDAWELYEERK